MATARGPPRPGYRSWFLSARSPDAQQGLWLRRTVHTGRDGRAHVASWCTTFGTATCTAKQIWPDGADAGLVASADRFAGTATGSEHRARWDLAVEASAPGVRPMSPGLLYRLPLPRTKVDVPVPAGTARGHVEVDGIRRDVDGWPVTIGHNWGSEHAEHWLWLHALDVGAFAWVELVAARVRLGARLLPWTATGVAGTGRRVHRLGGLRHAPSVGEVGPDRAELEVRAGGLSLAVTAVAGPATTFVAYRDPGGGTRTVVHCGLASLALTLTARDGRSTTQTGTCAVEVGSADGWPGVAPHALPLEPV